jgi:hypothetical protein
MLLQPSEQMVYSEQVETGPGGTKHEGTLYLTNRRLLFERAAGKGPAGPVTLLNAHLSTVTNVLVHSPMLGKALLQVETKSGTFSFRTKSAGVWSQQIVNARSLAPPPPPKTPRAPAPTSGATQPIVIQLHQENAPPSVFLHCTHCGTMNAADGSTRCKSCGASL